MTRTVDFFMFAALVTISIMDSRARPAGDESKERSDLKSPWVDIASWAFERTARESNSAAAGVDDDHDAENRISKSFDPKEIKKALSPLNRRIKFPDVLTRILMALKRKALDIRDAESFAQRMTKVSADSQLYPCFRIFEHIVEIYGIYEQHSKENKEAFQRLVQDVLDLFLFPYTDKHFHFSSAILAPLVTELIRSTSDDQANNIAETIANNLLYSKYVRIDLHNQLIVQNIINHPMSFILKAFDPSMYERNCFQEEFCKDIYKKRNNNKK